MAQIIKGDTFADGQQLNAARLNQLLDSAQLSAGAITEQSALAPLTVSPTDLILIYDASAGSLKKTSIADILGSGGIEIKTSTIVSNSTLSITTVSGLNIYGGLVIDDITSPTVINSDSVSITSNDYGWSIESTLLGEMRITANNLKIVTSNGEVVGPLKVSTPTLDAHAATKSYVDSSAPKVYKKSVTIPAWTAWGTAAYTTPSVTVPSGETWYYHFKFIVPFGNIFDNTRPENNADWIAKVGTVEVQRVPCYITPYGGFGVVELLVPITSTDTPTPKTISFGTATTGGTHRLANGLTNYISGKATVTLVKIKTSLVSDISTYL